MKKTNLHYLWRDRRAAHSYRTGVSLHSHTSHSQESMALIPRYVAAVPAAARAIRGQATKYRARTGRELDFGRAFWRPPLAPREAYDLESRQIEGLDLDPLVSLSDHDDIQAGALLSVVEPAVPVSVEWTIPFGPSFFHMGVHNLPHGQAPAIMADLAALTAETSVKTARARLGELLAMLDQTPEVLIVLNHPMWDEARIGALSHAQLLGTFLERYGDRIHALELNGLRPWSENSRVMWVAEHTGHALISGGDRHGLEPNANLNLTNAATFAEFVGEIREDRVSDVLFMPHYREPVSLRMIETIFDIVREYPEFPLGRRHWSDRVFYTHDDGRVLPLSASWKGNEPWPVKCFLGGLRAIKNQPVRHFLRMALSQAPEANL
jgi:hypothetical protein